MYSFVYLLVTLVINSGLHGVDDIFIPVSYTHLDVYKRQGLNRANGAKYQILS